MLTREGAELRDGDAERGGRGPGGVRTGDHEPDELGEVGRQVVRARVEHERAVRVRVRARR